jgi:chromosomal replication initiator protein
MSAVLPPFPKWADVRIIHQDCASFLCRLGLIPGHVDYEEVKPKRRFIADVQRAAADHFQIPLAEMTSARQSREVARPRQVAMYLSKKFTPCTLTDIGRRFGNRDHSTVMHAVRTVERLRREDPEFDATVKALEGKL